MRSRRKRDEQKKFPKDKKNEKKYFSFWAKRGDYNDFLTGMSRNSWLF
jgi:hypothetical protein